MVNSLRTNYSIEVQAAGEYATSKALLAETVKAEQTEVSKAVMAMKPGNRSKAFAIKADEQSRSKAIKLAKQSLQLRIVCNETGIVSLIDMPAIHNYVMTYIHPVSMLENARGLAQRGKEYLRRLDTQVLAGILITLANDYQLFRYQPADTGAQKNAIVRCIHRDTIIMAILLIEESVHSGNHAYLPQFSMVMDTNLKQGEIDVRFQFWMQTITEAIHRPDTEQWDENATVQSKLRREQQQKNKIEREADAAIRKKERELKQDCKLASNHIKTLFKDDRISGKLRVTLGSIFQEYQLLAMEQAAKALLISKLESIVHSSATALVEIAKKDRSGLEAKNIPAADFFDDAPVVARVIKADTSVQIVAIAPAPTLEVKEGQKIVTIGEQKFVVDAASYEALSFLERVRYNRKLVAGEV